MSAITMTGTVRHAVTGQPSSAPGEAAVELTPDNPGVDPDPVMAGPSISRRAVPDPEGPGDPAMAHPVRHRTPAGQTRRALRRLRAIEREAEKAEVCLTPWEKEFIHGVSERLEAYGSAFRDPAKGPRDAALSGRQTDIVRILRRKSRTKTEEGDGAASSATRWRRRPAGRRSKDTEAEDE